MILFTSLYSAIVAGALVFMSKINYDQSMSLVLALLVSVFLLILSVLGFQMVISQSLGHLDYIINVLMILGHWGKTGFFKGLEKPFFLKRSYRYFFEITTAFFIMLSLFYVILLILNPTKKQYGFSILLLLLLSFVLVFISAFWFIEEVLYSSLHARDRWERKLKFRSNSCTSAVWTHFVCDRILYCSLSGAGTSKLYFEYSDDLLLLECTGILRRAKKTCLLQGCAPMALRNYDCSLHGAFSSLRVSCLRVSRQIRFRNL